MVGSVESTAAGAGGRGGTLEVDPCVRPRLLEEVDFLKSLKANKLLLLPPLLGILASGEAYESTLRWVGTGECATAFPIAGTGYFMEAEDVEIEDEDDKFCDKFCDKFIPDASVLSLTGSKLVMVAGFGGQLAIF
jgi:hypothetical protein